MNKNKKILTIGILLLISGIIAALTSSQPSGILRYTFAGSTLTAGVLGVLIGRETKGGFVRSAYYSWIGFIMIGLSIALGIWATSAIAFISVLGFFLLILGVIEFVFVLQMLSYETIIPWKILGLKLSLAALTAIGATWIMTTAGYNVYSALLFLGVLFILAGFTYIKVGRSDKDAELSAASQ
jgi:uncharacterized membrane protein HdeD (DUF308 family)